MQGFSNEEFSMSEILDMVCAMSSFENINEETKNGYRVMHVKWASSTYQTDDVNAATKQTGGEEGEDQSEIHIAMRRSVNSSKNKQSLQTISQNKVSCLKNVKQFVKFCECTKRYFGLSVFFDYSCIFSTSLAQIIMYGMKDYLHAF
jgi:hypothetical protein